MGRSVSYPTDCAAVCFRHLDLDEDDCSWGEWDYFKDWIKEVGKAAWPSFDDCDIWLDREDHALLSNAHGFIGVSQYGTMVAIWLKPRTASGTDYPELAAAWCARIAPKFDKLFAEYRKIGTASNGESFYEKVKS